MKKFQQRLLLVSALLLFCACMPQAVQAGAKPVYTHSTYTLKIPKDMKRLPPGEFSGIQVEKVVVEPGSPYFKEVDGVLYSKDGSTLVYYPCLKAGASYRIPDGVVKISDMAFALNRKIKEVVLPKDLEALGSGAFFGCHNLRKVNLGQAKKLTKITDYNGYCQDLFLSNGSINDTSEITPDTYRDTVPFGKSTRFLDHYYMGTFEGTDLTSIRIPDKVRYLAEETFRDCDCLRKITFGKNFTGGINRTAKKRGKTVLLYVLNLKSIEFAGGNDQYCVRDNMLYSSDGKTLYQNLDKFNPQRTELVIDSSVSTIADGAFYQNVELLNVIVEGPLKEIGQNAFAGCDRLKSFFAKEEVSYLGKGAFYDCYNLTSFRCRGGVVVADTEAFSQCRRLTEVQSSGIPILRDETVFTACKSLPEKKFSPYVPDPEGR